MEMLNCLTDKISDNMCDISKKGLANTCSKTIESNISFVMSEICCLKSHATIFQLYIYDGT